MLKLMRLKHCQRKVHIAKGWKRGRKYAKVSLCGRYFTREVQDPVFDGNPEQVTCAKCLKTLDNSRNMFRK